MPIWFEYVSAWYKISAVDAEWKSLLRERLDPYEEPKDSWMDLYWLRTFPDLNEKGQGVLKRLSDSEIPKVKELEIYVFIIIIHIDIDIKRS